MKRFLALVAEGDAAYTRGEYEEIADGDLPRWLASLGTSGRVIDK